MALVPNPSVPGIRICRPKIISDYPLPDEESNSRSYLLKKIGSFYRKARRRLDSRRRRVQAHGLCVGLLDPVSNIVINSITDSCKGERKREGEVVLQEDLRRRSLDGLVVFLTRMFPNLAEGLAVRYLRVAKADVLIAACVIVSDHGIKGFGNSDAEPALINMALKCAGLAARHPDPKRLVYAWQKICNCIEDALGLLEMIQEPSRIPQVIRQLAFMVTEGPPASELAVRHAWMLAEASVRRRPRSLQQPHTHLCSRTLQDTIHGYYLEALARLPAGSCFHRSLIKAGHCYGPLDPVSNIIINTIWYHTAFPPSMKLELNAIGTRSLHRVANRSLYGLASFLCTRYHGINFHQAVCLLLQADGNLARADPFLDPDSHLPYGQVQCHPDTGPKEAFLAAATAACHPNPDAQVKFLTSCKEALETALSLLRRDSHKLSTQDVQQLARLLSPESPYDHDSEMALPPLPLKSYPLVDLADLYTVVSKGVNILLNKYEQMPNGDPRYELHTICGVNERVGGPAQWPPHDRGRFHVNFLATPKSPCGGKPTLFFAEIQSDGTYDSFCCPVALPLPCAAQIRCVYCEAMGTRIVHPVAINFRGRDSAFEMLAREKDPCQREEATLRIISHRRLMAENVHCKEKEDILYDGVDGHRNKFDNVSSLKVEEAMLLAPLCRYL
ncbi:uncharacterized protein LOC119326499 isoform X1 [Triticum dicoccoides]|uniref:uncharacterized protein LOC119326499 isoform X1 n=1 Tax=Triticum dicoccoides TaxID=85692 RepID=UPI0018910251|nr:uncharacterized protein LOC119326499 isoform X1 [Triticum dicoccoides]